MARIMVLEDQEDSFLLIQSALGSHHQLSWVKSVTDAMKIFDSTFQLAIVDVGLPDGDGFQFCDWVRSSAHLPQIPVLFLSGRNSVESRVTGYAVGGDDYISKPFNFVELKARVDAKLRWFGRAMEKVVDSRGIGIDLRSQRAWIRENGVAQDVDLTPIEFKILNMFLTEPEKVFSRDEILNRIWGEEIFVYPRSVDTHISKLRSKLGSKAANFRSVHGVGYKFTGDSHETLETPLPKSDSSQMKNEFVSNG